MVGLIFIVCVSFFRRGFVGEYLEWRQASRAARGLCFSSQNVISQPHHPSSPCNHLTKRIIIMWTGVLPAVTTKFKADGALDHAEMERCFALQMDAGCDGIIVCGSLGEGPMLTQAERIEVLKIAQSDHPGQTDLDDGIGSRHARGLRVGAQSRQGGCLRFDGGAEPDLPHRRGRDRRDIARGGGSRRFAGDDLLQPFGVSRRCHARDHGRAGVGCALRRGERILRRHSPHHGNLQSPRRSLRRVDRRRQPRITKR